MNKQKFFIIICLLAVCMTRFSQSRRRRVPTRNHYINLNYVQTKIDQSPRWPEIKSEWGAGFTVGQTFYLHKKPIGGFMKFGIDATWFDINYTNHNIPGSKQEKKDKEEVLHEAEVSMGVGPSLTFTPVKELNIHGYFRYAPTCSALYAGDDISVNYASMFVGGASLSFGVIGVGIESRWGDAKHYPIELEGINDDGDRLKTKFNGMRAYVTFRF